MNDVRIRFEGPCGSATGWCDSIVDTPGTCTIYSVTVFSMISCLPPSCDDHVIPFGIRTSHCSCTTPNCDFIQCHSTLAGDWWITVYGGTVSENPIFSPSHPDFTICQGDTILLSATADCGVPPYEYHWSPVGVVGDPIPAWPDTSTVFTSIVFDDCGNSDTVEQLVTVLPAPMLSLGPFEECYSVTMDAGPDWDSYLWSPGGETTQSITVDSSGI